MSYQFINITFAAVFNFNLERHLLTNIGGVLEQCLFQPIAIKIQAEVDASLIYQINCLSKEKKWSEMLISFNLYNYSRP